MVRWNKGWWWAGETREQAQRVALQLGPSLPRATKLKRQKLSSMELGRPGIRTAPTIGRPDRRADMLSFQNSFG